MKIGDVVEPIPPMQLRSGGSAYRDAVVISVEPFILASWGADMKWIAAVKPEEFRVIGQVEPSRLRFCKRRLKY